MPLDRALDPLTYRLGPGDQLGLSAGGISDFNVNLTVSPEGTIRVPNLGVRRVAGQTLESTRRMIAADLQKFFTRGPVEVVLLRPRSYKVVVAGDLDRPGTVVLAGPGRVYDAISLAGGLRGSPRRNIVLKRGGREMLLDLVAFQRLGDISQNPMLEDGDVLVVRAPLGVVRIYGGVNYPGEYEYREGESLGRLVEVAGGFEPSADTSRIRLLRFRGPESSDTLTLGATSVAGAMTLRDGDRVFISQDAGFHASSQVQISGQVRRPGIYPIETGRSRLSEILALAGGLAPDADSERVALLRPTENPPQDTAYVSYLLRGQDLKGFEREYAKMRSRTRAQMSLQVRDALRSPGSSADPVLVDGDILLVPRQATSILVQGEVVRPGLVPFQAGGDLSVYVRAAGGYTGAADKGSLWVTLGTTRQMVPACDAPPLRAGDVVWVPAKEHGNFWNTFKDVLLVAAQLSTLYLVVHDATK